MCIYTFVCLCYQTTNSSSLPKLLNKHDDLHDDSLYVRTYISHFQKIPLKLIFTDNAYTAHIVTRHTLLACYNWPQPKVVYNQVKSIKSIQ